MLKTKKAPSLKLVQWISGIFLAVSIVVFIVLGFFVQYQDLQETYALAKEASAFLQSECEKYDNYMQGISARSKQDLLDTALSMRKFISPSDLTDSDFLQDFIRTEHVSGVIVLDQQLTPLAQADMDDQDAYALWHSIFSKNCIKDILEHPQKTYIDHTSLKHQPYDYAVIANDNGTQLILCYTSTAKPASDPYELTIKNILMNNSLHKNPILAITDGTQVLSTNNDAIDKLEADVYQQLSTSIHWNDKKLTRFQYGNSMWYGLRRVYGDYFVYVVYPSEEVFSNRTDFITFGFLIYLAICVIVLMIQRHFDKLSIRKMEKQIGIINAISTSYASTFLLHIDQMLLEPIHPSDRLMPIFEAHPNPHDFLFAVCKKEVSASYYAEVMHFLDLDTIAERLKGQQFLGDEVQDCHGAWYSILLIPQSYDDEGNVLALLVTTRDVTSMKQAEELSFKDKLTGMHNRNYMESRSKSFVRSDDYPVSLIMADCNYLKRTNDTLGHEYGDLLLQRIANILQETIPEDSDAMRVGGDEFLIICPHCNHEAAHQLIAAIRQKLAERSDDTLTLSVSFGVSTTEEGEFNFAQAYEQADQEMYRDKQASRIQR